MGSELKFDNLVLKLQTEKPSEEVQKKAELELRETPQNIEAGLKSLKTLLEAEDDICAPITNDEWLLMFLRTSKFYPESARDLIRTFYTIRRKYPEVTNIVLPSKLKQVFDDQLVSILPQRDQHGRRIIVSICGGKWNYKKITQDEMLSASILCTYILQKEPQTQINGLIYVLDFEGLTIGHVMKFTLYYIKRLVEFTRDHVPLRMKGFHIVNQPKIFQPIFSTARKFFGSKLEQRVAMHGNNCKSLHQYIEPECLPKCYGGTLDTQLMHSDETYELLAAYEEFFQEFQKFGLIKKLNENIT